MSAQPDEFVQYGLAGDHGWNDSDEVSLGGLRFVLLLAAGTAYFGSTWLLSGLLPLPMLLSRLRGNTIPSASRRHIPA